MDGGGGDLKTGAEGPILLNQAGGFKVDSLGVVVFQVDVDLSDALIDGGGEFPDTKHDLLEVTQFSGHLLGRAEGQFPGDESSEVVYSVLKVVCVVVVGPPQGGLLALPVAGENGLLDPADEAVVVVKEGVERAAKGALGLDPLPEQGEALPGVSMVMPENGPRYKSGDKKRPEALPEQGFSHGTVLLWFEARDQLQNSDTLGQ